ncbi:MAG TPA: methionyl-tRNA formyltransferase, partial [Acidisarcina sp.]
PKWMIDLPRFGNINLHASLLPKYRGAAPIQWAIANGETVTGATTMRIDEGLDTGDMLLQREMAIGPDQTSEEIFPLLAASGAALMVETLEGLAAGTIEARKQDESRSSLAPILKREDGLVDFSRTAREIYNRWRGFQPWPEAYTLLGGKKLTLHMLRPAQEEAGTAADRAMGELRTQGDAVFVACAGGTSLQILELQLEGKKRLPVAEFLRGYPGLTHVRLGQ